MDTYTVQSKGIDKDSVLDNESSEKIDLNQVLCNHCGRTLNNGIGCLGICVADDDY